MTVIKVLKIICFRKVQPHMKPTGHYCFFSFSLAQQKKPSRTHKIASHRAKTRSALCQTWLKYRGNIIFIRKNTEVNIGDQKLLNEKIVQIMWIFFGHFLQFL